MVIYDDLRCFLKWMDPQVTMVVSIRSHGRNEFDDWGYPHGLDMSGKYHKP
jgi:hypothetical protein